MRRLLVLVVVAATLWGGWWAVGSRGVESGLATWIEARRAEGWQADYSDLSVRGFPNRFDTTITDLALADPDTGWAWQAPFFQLLALSYQPNHVIAVWPDLQQVSTPSQKITVSTGKMQASLVVQPDTDLALDRATLVLERFRLTSSEGWWAEMPSAQLATRAVPTAEHGHQIAFQATEMRPSAELLEMLGDTGLPRVFQSLTLDATIGFDTRWDRFAIEVRRPQPVLVDLRMLQADWGDLHLQAAGRVTVSADGTPTGNISVRATNWREILQIAVATGVVPRGVGGSLEEALSLIAGLSGNPNTLDVPLSFARGRVSLGPVPLGPAPKLVIR